jgi:glucose/arabinose dehydrogenase
MQCIRSWRITPYENSVSPSAGVDTGPCVRGDDGIGDGCLESEVVVNDLVYPWSIQKAGDVLVLTEVGGTIVMVEGGKTRRHRLQTTVPVIQDGGSGLLGLALSADFAKSGVAYVYHTYRAGTALANRVVEVTYDGKSWRETRVLLQGIPGHQLYNGGRVAIGPDGHLYVTTGWAHIDASAQDLGSLAGKVLRMRLDGGIPADNPFARSYVYSYGHRNPQGLAWRADGRLLLAEHGSSGQDELNLVVPGGNFGWPGTTGSQERAGVLKPLLHSASATWAPSGIAFYRGRLLVTALAARGLFAYDDARNVLEPAFSSGDRLRDVLPVGDDLYVITTNTSPRAARPEGGDRLLKLSRQVQR